MKQLFLALVLFSMFSSYGQSIKSFDYCYTNNKGICVYSIADKKEYVMVPNGTDPCISPDGTKVAYTANAKNGDRHVSVIELNTKQKTTLNTNNNNCYGPVWSPDGQYIAYNAFINNNWFTCIIDKDNHSPVNITKNLNTQASYSPTWGPDSKKILVQNMETVFVLNTSGSTVNKYRIADFTDVSGVSSATKFFLTTDETKLVFNCSVDEEGFEGPPEAIFVYDFKTRKTLRLSPKKYDCFQPILRGGKVFFCAAKAKSRISNIYSVDMDGKNLKLEFKNYRDFTAKKG